MTERSAGPAETFPLSAVPPASAGPARDTGSEAYNDLWRVVFEQAPFSTVVYDAAGRLLAVNAVFEAFWGVSLETAPPDYSVLQDRELERQGILPLVQRAFAGETVVTPPVHYDISKLSTTAQGRTLWTQAHLYPVRDAAGRVTHVVLTHIDLTDRIAAEEALRASERRFAAIVQQAAAGIAQVDLTGRFTLVNDRYCEILGRPREELLALRMQDITHPDDLPRNLPLFTDAVGSGSSFVIEKRYLRPDGSVVWVNNSVAAIRGLSGETESVLAVAFEVTDRRRAMERLELLARENERLYEAERTARMAAERLQELTLALSGALSSDEVGRVVMHHGIAALGADAGVLALLTPAGDELEIASSIGYPAEACMGPGQRWPITMSIPIAEATRTGASVIIASPEAWGYRYLGGYTPRSSTSAAWAAFPLVLDGRTAGALLWTYHQPRRFLVEEVSMMETVARQCTQALERASLLQAERRARADAEAANSAKSEFLSAMSHELRTPLNAIFGYVDLLEVGVHGPLTDAQREDLRRIRNAQEVLLGLISDILNFARIEAGRIEYQREAVPLRPLLAELEGLIDPQMQPRGLHYRWGLSPEDLVVTGDRERIRQILMNLLSNALKFTEPGGRVEVRAEAEAEQVRIRVSDTGRGIPAGRLEEIFSPFVQVDRHGTPESQQGVGLGLAISRELARAMGGELTVESELARGSTFTLTLPRVTEPPAPGPVDANT